LPLLTDERCGTRVADVFISYKREDRRLVERLAGALQQLGFEVWWDFELLTGENFRQVIRAVIDQCRAAVVVWSEAAARSSFVLDEASYAQRLGRLCPVRIDAVELPFGFGQLHADDLADWDGELSHAGFQALVRSLEARAGRKATLGAAVPAAQRQTAAAELEAFKAAQLAATPGALRTFVANFPDGAFAPFVRDQIETLEKERPPRSRARAAVAASPAVAQEAAGERSARRVTKKWAAVAIAVAMAGAAGGFLYQQSERQAREAAEVARKKAEEDRIAAQRRASELEAQAASERAARERAEQRSEALQRKTDQERQALAQAGSSDAERKRRDGAYSVERLHPDLRGIVVAARRNALDADGAALRARSAATLSEAAAARAKAGQPGTVSLGFDGGTYLGEGSGSTRSGHGVTAHNAASKFAGDRYAGQYRDSQRSGLGVYTFADNPGNTNKRLRREGEYAADRPNGLGILVWRSGDRHAGHWKDGVAFGPGVRTFADGRRYEGDFAGDQRHGLGVLWAADGKVVSAGVWKDGTFAAALAP